MISLSARDFHTANEVWRLAKRHLNPAVRRRIGWRGRSSFLRELLLYGYEQASARPAEFFRSVRDAHDPLFGRRGRGEVGADRREALVAEWEGLFPAPARSPRAGRSAPRASSTE